MFLFQKTHAENEPDNVSKLVTPRQDTRIDTILFVFILIMLLFIWIVAIIFSGVQCAALYVTICATQSLIVYAPLVLIALSFIGFVVIALWKQWYIARKERLANALYQHYDYTKPNEQLGYMVAQIIAKSLATAQLDTLSQTGANTPSKPNERDGTDINPLANARINIEDIFLDKE